MSNAHTVPEARNPEPGTPWYTAAPILHRSDIDPGAFASQRFQDDPRPVSLVGAADPDAGLFTLLARLDDPVERAAVFRDYALAAAWLHEPPERRPSLAERERRGFPAVLRGWAVDSNGVSGAVLKGWAESRFGLRVLHHGGRLADPEQDARYAGSRRRGAAGGLLAQLDLLYRFTQVELARSRPDERWLTLYRGSHDPEAYVVKDGDGTLVEFNAVSSFTADRETAWEFGSRVWAVRVPLAKIVCAAGLLPGLLDSEQEHIVLGGDFRVEALRW
ncbi:MAG: hypothetical protein RLZZ127_1843 [Planctomycetota bacterium]|jgi:NAD+--dinitrogen-reductase ADP-D-ribosyltransferase